MLTANKLSAQRDWDEPLFKAEEDDIGRLRGVHHHDSDAPRPSAGCDRCEPYAAAGSINSSTTRVVGCFDH